ncbi:hypothetical protein [Stenotrophomonas phage BUCT627]|uniref:Uncharacterized protein n=2 Tax=Bixiavirus TaxID=3044676 RepID=A0A7D2HHW1_9CAUD|nr:hypothetical protein PQD75_gp058 [Stenotrophomonas phage vB_SmaS_BUCT548]YP_010677418.1 hypothetical protein PQD77_gp012 [Stenotrophomonas phage BUCT627]QIQ60814.1 hypothetical protein [Stenotrophomonas phage vB_SmaS_BUCT548]QYC96618.1 hypothetical protein [Stenotrophomonas phage BUCT627]WFG37926.1 hypothetical protein 20Sep420_00041 [Pseudomonas phage 20Sep420]
MSRFVERMERRWELVALNGRVIDQQDQPAWLITEVCLTDDMDADIAKLMNMAVGDTISDHNGDTFKRIR